MTQQCLAHEPVNGVVSARRPVSPYLVLAAAILLPGSGHVLCGRSRRGLIMQLFMIVLGFVTWQLAPPQASIVGRLSGGLFVYALSITDAYAAARLRWRIAKNDAQAGHKSALQEPLTSIAASRSSPDVNSTSRKSADA